MHVLTVRDFDLGMTLRSGQFFRYRENPDGGFVMVTQGRRILARQRGDRVEFEGAEPDFTSRFLGLDDDAGGAHAALSADPVLRPVLRRHAGLRLMRQDPWECTLAFICSANSNIPRITRNLEDLARLFGRRHAGGGAVWHDLPRPGEIAAGAALRRVRLGYRERYVAGASGRVSAAWLESLRGLPLEEARRAIRSVPGVGEKVGDCILLFSLGFGGAFPVDVWIRRALRTRYGLRRATDRRMREFAADRYGPYAGYAQQVLYVLVRGARSG